VRQINDRRLNTFFISTSAGELLCFYEVPNNIHAEVKIYLQMTLLYSSFTSNVVFARLFLAALRLHKPLFALPDQLPLNCQFGGDDQ
jgi:hypothetical protein